MGLPTIVEAVRASSSDASLVATLLSSGPSPILVTEEQVLGTMEAGSHCFLLEHGDDVIGFVELRAVHTEPERSDAAAVVWVVQRRPIGIGAAALLFLLRYAFETLGLREIWGWVRRDNASMLRLCRHLGIVDSGPWAGDPEFRLMAFPAEHLAEIVSAFERLRRKLRICEHLPPMEQKTAMPAEHGADGADWMRPAEKGGRTNDAQRHGQHWSAMALHDPLPLCVGGKPR